MLRIFRVVGALIAFWGLVACQPANPPYRVLSLTEPACAGEPIALGPGNREEPERAETEAAQRQKCFLQKHLLPSTEPTEGIVLMGQDMVDSATEWRGLALAAGRELTEPGEYTLGFVEITDEGGDWVAGQLDAVTAHLSEMRREGRQNVVVTYVHGWRHDAALRNGDVRKLRRMLAYTRAALNARCIANGDYCDATLTGVFVGWRGRRHVEPEGEGNEEDQGLTFGFLSNATSFWKRWDVSRYLGDGNGKPIGKPDLSPAPLPRVLKGIERELRLAQGRSDADKLLIFGHSMGGNMLASMMEAPSVRAIQRHARGGQMRPLFGDLVVLLNPAARAENWARVQLAERAKAGFKEGDNEIWCDPGAGSKVPCRPGSRLGAWQSLYPINQRPVYISLTAAGEWGFSEGRRRPVISDSATRDTFPFARQWAGETEPLHVTAIGHLIPPYNAKGTGLTGQAIGTSHEVAILQGVLTEEGRRYRSTYENATRPAAAWCAPGTGWLREARQEALDDPGLPSWDYGYVRDAEEGELRYLRNIGGNLHHASVQWRHAVYLPRTGHAFSVAPANSPFWNVRALDTAIKGHAGWAKFPIWCAINQLVLDDVTAPRPAPVPEDTLAEAAIDPDQ